VHIVLVPVIYLLSLFVIIYLGASLVIIIVHLFCSLFDYSFVFLFDFISHGFFAFIRSSLFKREKNNSDPELCSGILISLTVNSQ
jgi:hypothetical protein